MAKYYLKCPICGNTDFKYIKEVNLYTCNKCNQDYDPDFDIGDMLTVEYSEKEEKIRSNFDN